MSDSLSLSTTDGTKWTSFKYDWGIWKKAEPVYQITLQELLKATTTTREALQHSEMVHSLCKFHLRAHNPWLVLMI